MPGDLRSVTVKFPPPMFEQIRLMAEKRGETLSDTVRYLIKRGMSERILEENAQLIGLVVRAEMESVMRSYVVMPSLDAVERPENLGFQERIRLRRQPMCS